MVENDNTALTWDSEVEGSAPSFDPLPAGEYDFRVSKFERGQFNGSAKMAACPVAKLELEVTTGEYVGRKIFERLFLNKKVMWKIAQFFTCVGLRPAGSGDEPFRPDWSSVPGASGRLSLSLRSWTGNDGSERQGNEVKAFLEPDQANTQPTPSVPAQGGWTPPADTVQAPPAVQATIDAAVRAAQAPAPGVF
ncbi:DUF669 domain-containing protein [Collinsella sp. AGMB00827]|uniref:DUF669 domain-containing protein n=1 Tax=Collinsella ureilytica TaxID=2869515 RepID=A0ABS7MHA5_9ACTN|nr:DUF669 domain-containing protein [Collinsella urealyticum]MBY4796758.1 DUF669 domain-containing protein [Collinsella urealyticum]